jgi:hypothetical protein
MNFSVDEMGTFFASSPVWMIGGRSWRQKPIAFTGLPKIRITRIYLSNCGMGGRIACPGQRFSEARPLAALSTGNHVIPVRRR